MPLCVTVIFCEVSPVLHVIPLAISELNINDPPAQKVT